MEKVGLENTSLNDNSYQIEENSIYTNGLKPINTNNTKSTFKQVFCFSFIYIKCITIEKNIFVNLANNFYQDCINTLRKVYSCGTVSTYQLSVPPLP